ADHVQHIPLERGQIIHHSRGDMSRRGFIYTDSLSLTVIAGRAVLYPLLRWSKLLLLSMVNPIVSAIYSKGSPPSVRLAFCWVYKENREMARGLIYTKSTLSA